MIGMENTGIVNVGTPTISKSNILECIISVSTILPVAPSPLRPWHPPSSTTLPLLLPQTLFPHYHLPRMRSANLAGFDHLQVYLPRPDPSASRKRKNIFGAGTK